MGSKELLLDELKTQYNKDFELKDSLDNKSSYLIPISGLIISLIFGFGINFLEKVDNTYSLFLTFNILLITTLVFHLVSIFFSILSFRIRDYRYAFLYRKFYDKNGKIIDSKIEEYTEADEEDFKDMILRAYLKCNFQNSRNNQSKAYCIKISQYCLLVGLAILSSMIIMLFVNPPQFS